MGGEGRKGTSLKQTTKKGKGSTKTYGVQMISKCKRKKGQFGGGRKGLPVSVFSSCKGKERGDFGHLGGKRRYHLHSIRRWSGGEGGGKKEKGMIGLIVTPLGGKGGGRGGNGHTSGRRKRENSSPINLKTYSPKKKGITAPTTLQGKKKRGRNIWAGREGGKKRDSRLDCLVLSRKGGKELEEGRKGVHRTFRDAFDDFERGKRKKGS